MKISPISGPGATVGAMTGGPAPEVQSAVQKLRSMKMNTNATPGYTAPPDHAADVSPLSIADDNVDQTTAAVEATQPLSPQLAAIAKAKRALDVREKAIADREKAALERPTSQEGVVDVAKLKSDPLGVLLNAGVTYDQLTEAVLSSQSNFNPELAALKEQLKALETGFDKKLSDREAQAEQAALAEMRKDADRLAAQGDDFELVRETGSIPEVMKLIERTYKETGEVLDVREAMQLIEDELIKDSLKVASFKKVQSKLAPAAPAAQPQQQQRQMRTLTNRDTASVPLGRKARAIAAATGTLKK